MSGGCLVQYRGGVCGPGRPPGVRCVGFLEDPCDAAGRIVRRDRAKGSVPLVLVERTPLYGLSQSQLTLGVSWGCKWEMVRDNLKQHVATTHAACLPAKMALREVQVNRCIVDNIKDNFERQKSNGIEILTWISDPEDRELYKLGAFLQKIAKNKIIE